MEFVRNVFLVGKKNKSGAARWLTSFTMMLLILVSVYLQKPMKEFPKNMDMVLQHQQENATFNRASCKIEAIEISIFQTQFYRMIKLSGGMQNALP